MAGIYIHIPFCKQACNYCDFHFSTKQSNRKAVVEAICTELVIQKHFLENQSIETVYLGGGTPSLLVKEEMGLILDTLKSSFNVTRLVEMTLESNPDDLTTESLRSYKSLGINRLSIGIQSFFDNHLKWMNRSHTAEDAIQSFNRARENGFENISIDLIYGIPGSSMEQWDKNLKQAIELSPDHISCYSLTVEPRTALKHKIDKGEVIPEKEEIMNEYYLKTHSILKSAGYTHYEISNYAFPGKNSVHNSNYWNGVHYLGVGPSSHSFDGKSRMSNVSNNIKYLKSIKEHVIPNQVEYLDNHDIVNESIMTSLRTSGGFDLNFSQDIGIDFKVLRKSEIDRLLFSKLAIIEDNHLILTLDGQLLADNITSDLFIT